MFLSSGYVTGLELTSITIELMVNIICCVHLCVRVCEREREREKLSWALCLSLNEDQQSLIGKICSPLAMI